MTGSTGVDESLLELQQVQVQFPGQLQPTLEDISLQIRPGEFLGIVGPSGCGKSTLLRVLAGLLPPTSGVRKSSDSEGDLQELDRPGGIAMVFQEARLLPWRTVLENMRLPYELTGAAVDEQRIEDLLSRTGIQPDDYRKYPRMLSGGMKMRVAVARALVLQPRLVLLDEPFAAVDDLLREQLNSELLSLQQTFGFAAVLVTHHLAEAVYLSQQVLVMSTRPGRIEQRIPLHWPLPRPAELRETAEFASQCGQIKRHLKQQA